jgi:rhamnose transport system permease protein
VSSDVARPGGLPASLLRWEVGLALALVAVVVFGSTSSAQFFTHYNTFNLGLTTGEIAIMTLPMTLIVISGEIDLSVASTLGMSSAVLGYLWQHGWPMSAIFGALLVLGAVAGAFNGFLVTRLGLPSLAVTIGTLAVYRGIADIVLGPTSVSTFPSTYTNIGVNPLPHTNLPFSVGLFIIFAIGFGVVLHATPFGRSIFAMGANQEAALFAGIRVKRVKMTLFVVSGVVCSMCGALWTFRLSTAVQNNGVGLELDVIAIVLLAGVSIFGGKGTIVGVVLAVLVFAGLQNALLLTNFNQEATGIVTGSLLLVSVLVPNSRSFATRLRTRFTPRHHGATFEPAGSEL